MENPSAPAMPSSTPTTSAANPAVNPGSVTIIEPAKAAPVSADITLTPSDDFLVGDLKPATPPTKAPAKPAETPAAPADDAIPSFDDKVETPAEPEPEPAPEPGKPKRDYSAFSAELQAIAKKLPNQQFATLERLVKENKDLSKKAAGALPETYFEHPEAYTLTPEYRQAAESAQVGAFEENHWREQLVKIMRGEDWIDYDGTNPQTGQPIFRKIPVRKDPSTGEPIVDHNAQLQVQGWLQKAQQIRENGQIAARNLQSQFSQQHNNVVAGLKKSENELFPHMAEENNPYSKDIQRFSSLLPGYMRNHPLASMLVKSGAQNIAYRSKIEELNKRISMLEGKKVIDTAAQPNSRTVATGGTGGSSNVFDPKTISSEFGGL